VVFDTKNIYEIDPKLASGMDIGAKVRRKSDGMTGVIYRKFDSANYKFLVDNIKERIQESPSDELNAALERYQKAIENNTKFQLDIKWKRGGRDYALPFEVEPVE
jgi:hypothetical protein